MDPKQMLIGYASPGIDLLGYPGKDYLSAISADEDFPFPILWSVLEKTTLKDLEEYRHVLIVGATGTGKTAFLHQLLLSLLYKRHPAEIKLILIDLKKIEFKPFALLENHFMAKVQGAPSVIAETATDAVYTLNSLCIEMDSRYELLTSGAARDYKEYNDKIKADMLDPESGHHFLPVLIVCIDELADCILHGKKEVNTALQRLVYNAGKIGIFIIVSTNQYTGTQVISSALLKGFQQRIAFRFNDRQDYQNYFDTVRVPALNLPGEFLYREYGKPVMGKGYMFSATEISAVCNFIAQQPALPDTYLLPGYFYETREPDLSEHDPLFEDAARLLVQSQLGSASLIQRRMKLGYNRAGRLMDQLEAAGVVGPNHGANAREVLLNSEAELQEFLDSWYADIPYVRKPRPGKVEEPVLFAHKQAEPIYTNSYQPQRAKQKSYPAWVIILAIIIMIGMVMSRC